MSGLPGTPQAPVAPTSSDPPPPTITVEDIMGGGAAAVLAAARPTGAPAPAPAAPPVVSTSTPAGPVAADLNELSQYFGVQVTEGQDAATTQAALRPVLDMIARGGMQQAQQENNQAPSANQYGQVQPPTAPTTAPPAADSTFDMDSIDLSDASPQVVKAFKALNAHNQKALAVANHNAKLAVKSSQQVQQQFAQQADQQENAQRAEVESRAVTYLDGLASPKYGVGSSRTMVQTMASEQVMKTAGHLIRGMKAYGQVMPIESVMSAAILATDGAMPAAPAPYQSTPAALAPQTPTMVAPALPTRGVGSTGSAGAMMSDPEFMDGARAILAR